MKTIIFGLRTVPMEDVGCKDDISGCKDDNHSESVFKEYACYNDDIARFYKTEVIQFVVFG